MEAALLLNGASGLCVREACYATVLQYHEYGRVETNDFSVSL